MYIYETNQCCQNMLMIAQKTFNVVKSCQMRRFAIASSHFFSLLSKIIVPIYEPKTRIMLLKQAKQKYKQSMALFIMGLFVAGGISMAATYPGEQPDEHMEAETFEVVVMVQPDEGGEVEGAGEYYPGEEVVLEATANDGYDFLQWTDNIQGFVVSSDVEYTFEMPEEDVNLTALFVELLE